MKTIKLFGILLLTAMTAFSTVSCGDDDDEKEIKPGKEIKPDNKNGSALLNCPDNKHPHAIDLGLPSGTKWACCNLGASTPESFGKYFAWGETSPKDIYTRENHVYYSEYNYALGKDVYVNIGTNIAGTNYDAATANWGAPWKMPTNSQIEELIDLRNYNVTKENGVAGMRFMGNNGGSIFLPAAGGTYYGNSEHVGEYGCYWSSSILAEDSRYARILFFYIYDYYLPIGSHSERFEGLPIRPVR